MRKVEMFQFDLKKSKKYKVQTNEVKNAETDIQKLALNRTINKLVN